MAEAEEIRTLNGVTRICFQDRPTTNYHTLPSKNIGRLVQDFNLWRFLSPTVFRGRHNKTDSDNQPKLAEGLGYDPRSDISATQV